MVWTAIVRAEARDPKVFSVIFESEHDPASAYKDLLSRETDMFKYENKVIVMIPGSHTSMYFPKAGE